MREYRTVDKTGWGDGPWADEPDKVVWVDETTGLDCLIVRGPAGALCGYVGVPASHPWHGRNYCDVDDLDVHWGLTYSAACSPEETEATGICHTPDPGRPDDIWWFGFDCHHIFDIGPAFDARQAASYGWRDVRYPGEPERVYRTVGYVTAEVGRLACQLAAPRKP